MSCGKKKKIVITTDIKRFSRYREQCRIVILRYAVKS